MSSRRETVSNGILKLVLSACLIIGSTPMPSLANEDAVEQEGFVYQVDSQSDAQYAADEQTAEPVDAEGLSQQGLEEGNIAESVEGPAETIEFEDEQVTVCESEDGLVETVDPAEQLDEPMGAPAEGVEEADGATTSVSWQRLGGNTALDTMRVIVGKGFSSSDCVVVATASSFKDALTASGLAGLLGCPLLITGKGGLSAQTRAEIVRLGASKCYVIGGAAVIPEQVVSQIASAGNIKSIERIYGQTAADTAIAVFNAGDVIQGWNNVCFVATAKSAQDALAASPVAYARRCPILLATTKQADGSYSLNDKTIDTIKEYGFAKVVICGGTSAVSSKVEGQLSGVSCMRKAGKNSIETSIELANYGIALGMKPDKLGVATAEGYKDALCGAAFCGHNNAPIVLARNNNRSAADNFVAKRKGSIKTAYMFGGKAALSDDTLNYFKSKSTTSSPSNPSNPPAQDDYVLITKTGECYHRLSGCRSTANASTSKVSLAEAKRRGLRPCKNCYQ